MCITGEVSGETARVTNGGLDVNVQDQHTRALDLLFIQAAGVPTTLSVESVPDTRTVTLTSTTGFVAGIYVGVFSLGADFYLGQQLGAPAGNVITLDTPMDKVYPVGSLVLPFTFDMNVDGSSVRKIFQVGSAGSGIDLDITRIVGHIQAGAAMDDSLFGNLAALVNGCVLRRADGSYQNLWNVKTNGDLGLLSGVDFEYTDSAPAGSFGARFRIGYGGQDKHGVTLRLLAGETLEFIIQDNLTGLEAFHMMAQGHVVE